jgi:CarboxypepD_reg-like domain
MMRRALIVGATGLNAACFLALSVLLMIVGPLPVLSQTSGALTGKIIDAQTKAPIPFASVFLANTMMGTRGSADGTYELRNIPAGKYDLTVTSVGYTLMTVPVVVLADKINLDIELPPETKLLKEVEFKLSESDYREARRNFVKYFLGETQNSRKCQIINLDNVVFQIDNDQDVLIASIEEPLVIRNDALGYRVYYVLKEFKLDFKKGFCAVGGVPRFDTLSPKNSSQAQHWETERKRAYKGSLNHFMRSLKFSCLKENDFQVYLMTPKAPGVMATETEMRDNILYAVNQIDESVILGAKPNARLLLKIVYNGETEEFNYMRRTSRYTLPQRSYLKYLKHGLIIHDNGYHEDPLSYFIDGYFAWTEKVAELIPLEYQPPGQFKSKDKPKADLKSESKIRVN